MEEEYEDVEIPRRKDSALTTVLAVLIVGIIVGSAVVYVYINALYEKQDIVLIAKDAEIADLSVQVTDFTSEVISLTEEVLKLQKDVCIGEWMDGTGCIAPEITLLSPVGGETFCYDEIVKVVWEPTAIPGDIVDILLTRPQSFFILDTVRTSRGSYDWNVKRSYEIPQNDIVQIEEGDLYRIKLQLLDGELTNSESGLFTITAACEE